MNINTSELPYTTRVEFSPARGRNTLVFQDKTLPLTMAYPVPEQYNHFTGNSGDYERRMGFNEGVEATLRLVYLEQRQNIIREFQQQRQIQESPSNAITGALLDGNPDGPEAG